MNNVVLIFLLASLPLDSERPYPLKLRLTLLKACSGYWIQKLKSEMKPITADLLQTWLSHISEFCNEFTVIYLFLLINQLIIKT